MAWIEGKIAENLADVLGFFITWVLPFIIVFGAIWLGYRLKDLKIAPSVSIDNLAKVTTDILNKIHEKDWKLKNPAVKQYLTLFSLKDFRELWDNYATIQNKDAYKSIKKELGGKKLKKDKIQRRSQIDNLQQRLSAIIKPEEWTLKDLTKLTSFLEQFPKTQNNAYQGIGKRRETDKRWQALFLSLNNLKIEHAQVFTDEELNQMLDEYLDTSKVAVTTSMFAELLEKYITIDIMPTEYLVSGIEDASIKIRNRMSELLEDISKKITELERQQRKINGWELK